MSVIDFGEMEKHIKQIEELFKKEGLNVQEQQLVLSNVQARISKRVKDAAAQDLVSNVKIGGLLGKAMGMVGKSKEELRDK